MDLAFITSIIVQVLIIPIQVIIVPIDAFLNLIPGISIIPDSISAVAGFISTIPSTLVSLFGINPLLWNATILLFIAYIALVPGINLVKKIWSFVRP